MKRPTETAEINPITKTYDFNGPLGAVMTAISTPILVLALYFGCSEASGGCPPAVSFHQVIQALKSPVWWRSLWDTQCFLIFLAWYGFCVLAWLILPGKWVRGTKLRNGSHQLYKLNGFATYLLVLSLSTFTILYTGPSAFTLIHARWPQFTTAGVALALIESIYCYASSFRPEALLSLGGNAGNLVYDWFIGRQLNPSIGHLDLKYFHCLRFGLISWAVVDISMVCEQATRLGGFGNVSNSIYLLTMFQLFYVGDALYHEDAYLTSMEIIHEGLGFMLALGHFVVVPFMYSLQTRYLAFQPIQLSHGRMASLFVLNFIGYYIYRASNSEKHAFRQGLNRKNPHIIQTKAGSNLLVSGWWGWSRHPNYFGDLLMGYAWCLTTGFNTPIPYFYAAFVTGLLISRQQRDDEICAAKYGRDWQAYKEKVPYRMVRYIF